VIQRVRAVVVCWNNAALIDGCVTALRATRWDGDLEIVVVDNGSSDGSVDGWEARHPDVRLVQTGANLGFAGGMNRGLAALADRDAVALVNSDAFVEPGWLVPLVAALDADGGVGAASPKILLAEPDEQGRPVINNVGNELGPRWEPHDRGLGEVDTGQYDQEEDIWGWCGGAVLLRRRYLDDVGLFDERLFMYAEDVDLAWRGARRGWRYRYVPTSIVRHLHRASSGGERTPRLDLLNRRNRLVVVTRHGGLRATAGAWTRAVGGIVVATGTDLIGPLLHGHRPDPAPWRRRVRAAVDAVRLLAGGNPPLP
jgi:N-acetylglucosaminyl-diphospho-decaprenol L-rhamnosyltransferase